jgi:adenosylcobyric acid synthase
VLAGTASHGSSFTLLGICGGFQMLGVRISDGVESVAAETPGLGILPVETAFDPKKIVRRSRGTVRSGTAKLAKGTAVEGYEIRNGRPRLVERGSVVPWLGLLQDGVEEEEGAADAARGLYATSLHGIFEIDAFREGFLAEVAGRRGKRWAPSGLSFAGIRERRLELLADLVEEHMDLEALSSVISEGAALRRSGLLAGRRLHAGRPGTAEPS